ncbi:MAG: aspartate ammonia-lyase [Candidatus Micrarchaeota archaeon]|nr:aspartate ammonia-lyase [Candidatus Micrarchaeota archaeon]
MRYRTEKDSLGSVKVRESSYFGSNTQRAVGNFPISGIRLQKSFIRAYAIVKRSAALANISEGLLDRKRGAAIVRACDEIIAGKLEDQFAVDVFQAGAGTSTNMNLNEVIANRGIELLGGRKGEYTILHPNDHVNMSQSTNDTFHAAMHISAYLGIKDRLIPSLEGLESALDRKAREFAGLLKVGRTHLQDAVPITLGQEFSGYSYAIEVESDRLRIAMREVEYLPIGGTAVGTGINTTADYSKIAIKEINRSTKCRFKRSKNLFYEQQDQASEAFVSGAVRGTAMTLLKMSADLRLLGSGPSAGLGEIRLPAVQAGSSIMPGKVNPSMAEMLSMACFEAIGNDLTISGAAQGGQLELNVFMPIIAYKLIKSIETLSNAIDAFTSRCVMGIEANEEVLGAYFEASPEIATLLAPVIGYDKVALVVKEAIKTHRPVREIILSKRLLDKRRLDELLKPSNVTGPNLKRKR